MVNGSTTTLTPATPSGKSLRATVPISIVRQFRLKIGDKLNWTIEARNGELIVVVTPEKKDRGLHLSRGGGNLNSEV